MPYGWGAGIGAREWKAGGESGGRREAKREARRERRSTATRQGGERERSQARVGRLIRR